MFKYMWEATFEDGNTIRQPQDDRYSKHDDKADHNPSAFRDILDYSEKSPLTGLALLSTVGHLIYAVDLRTGVFYANGAEFTLEQPLEELKDRKIIYYRTMRMDMKTHEQYCHAFNLGYEGKDENDKIIKKVITIL